MIHGLLGLEDSVAHGVVVNCLAIHQHHSLQGKEMSGNCDCSLQRSSSSTNTAGALQIWQPQER